MSDPVHRAAPESARGRGLLTLLSSSVAAVCFGAVLFLHGTIVPFLVAVGGIAVVIAFVLGYGLTRQAAAAPEEANPAARRSRPDDETDPVTTLQQRYAEGELTDEEFERRMERLMESDRGVDEKEEREPAFER